MEQPETEAVRLVELPGQTEVCPVMETARDAAMAAFMLTVNNWKMSAITNAVGLAPFRLEFPWGVPPVFRRMLNTCL